MIASTNTSFHGNITGATSYTDESIKGSFSIDVEGHDATFHCSDPELAKAIVGIINLCVARKVSP
jgi:hypothetical protein